MARYTIEGKRYDTQKMVDLEISTLERHGVKITGVYMTPRSKRVFVETHSIWDQGDGRVVGARLHEAGRREIAALAQEHDCEELYSLVPDDSE